MVVNATKDRPDDSAYRIPIAIQFAWAAIIGLGVLLLPESPRFLLMKNKTAKGRRALSRLLGQPEDSEEVHRQYSEMMASLEHDRKSGRGGWSECFKMRENKALLRITTGIVMQAFNQLSGVSPGVMHTLIADQLHLLLRHELFPEVVSSRKENIKLTPRGISNPFLITIATNVVFTGMTPFGMWAADYIGRRPLMLWGGAGMAASQLIVAIVGTAAPSSDATAQKVLVAFVCLYIATFSISWATLAWVMTAEINPYELRAKGMTMSTASNWLWVSLLETSPSTNSHRTLESVT